MVVKEKTMTKDDLLILRPRDKPYRIRLVSKPINLGEDTHKPGEYPRKNPPFIYLAFDRDIPGSRPKILIAGGPKVGEAFHDFAMFSMLNPAGPRSGPIFEIQSKLKGDNDFFENFWDPHRTPTYYADCQVINGPEVLKNNYKSDPLTKSDLNLLDDEFPIWNKVAGPSAGGRFSKKLIKAKRQVLAKIMDIILREGILYVDFGLPRGSLYMGPSDRIRFGVPEIPNPLYLKEEYREAWAKVDAQVVEDVRARWRESKRRSRKRAKERSIV
jgi:hypothetical protein